MMNNIALLVIDTQTLITNDKVYRFGEFVENVKRLIGSARENGVEVIYVRHDDGADKPLTKGKAGYEVYSGFAPQSGEMIFDKTVNSPFRDTGLKEYLRGNGITTVIVTGLQTDYSIDATVKCAFEHHFDVVVPQYANSTTDNAFMDAETTYRFYNEHMWNGRYARCLTVDETIELMK